MLQNLIILQNKNHNSYEGHHLVTAKEFYKDGRPVVLKKSRDLFCFSQNIDDGQNNTHPDTIL